MASEQRPRSGRATLRLDPRGGSSSSGHARGPLSAPGRLGLEARDPLAQPIARRRRQRLTQTRQEPFIVELLEGQSADVVVRLAAELLGAIERPRVRVEQLAQELAL